MNRSIHLNATIINSLQEGKGHKKNKKKKKNSNKCSNSYIYWIILTLLENQQKIIVSELNREARIGEFRQNRIENNIVCYRRFYNILPPLKV